MARRSIPWLLVVVCLLLWAAPASSAPGGTAPAHPAAVADAQAADAVEETSQCHPFLHASETAAMAFGQGAERDPAQTHVTLEPFPRAAAAGTCRVSGRLASGPPGGERPLYVLTGRLRL